MNLIGRAEVASVFEHYPEPIRNKLRVLRRLIIAVAEETEGIDTLEETLRWGEPSYIANIGSAIRIDWKKANPHQYAMYFNCKTSLVDTFKEIYGDRFSYEGNRAIVFEVNDEIPVDELKPCIASALTYRIRRHLPRLGL